MYIIFARFVIFYPNTLHIYIYNHVSPNQSSLNVFVIVIIIVAVVVVPVVVVGDVAVVVAAALFVECQLQLLHK